MTRVCVVGSINADVTFSVGALPRPGETILASSLSSSPGGKGANQAVAAARAGAQVQFVGALGADAAAKSLRDHLRANGVGLDGLVTMPGPSGTAGIIVDAGGENMIVVAPGANAHLMLDDRQRAVVAGADVVLLQLEIPAATAVAAARAARSAGATVVLNASPASEASELADLAAATDVVVVNEAEAAGWRWAVPHLVVTRGRHGARYVGPNGAIEVPAPAVEAVDSTGAGDVFAGVLAAAWPGDRRHALRRACAAGALATLVPGAGDCAPSDEAIEDALSRSS
jgi:ribokinase